MLELLLAHESYHSCNYSNCEGETPLSLTVRSADERDDLDSCEEAVHLLTSLGAESAVVTEAGGTLQIAAARGSVALLRLLLSATREPNVRDSGGRCATHCAGQRQDPAIMQLLVDSGARVRCLVLV